jgi:endogenous inhibitor of DNA gyrase (YacG/DUF329 family)
MRVVPCPQCGAEVAWTSTPTRPFCSERCRLIDLGAWLDEKYTIPGPLTDESASVDEDSPAAPKRKDDGHHS